VERHGARVGIGREVAVVRKRRDAALEKLWRHYKANGDVESRNLLVERYLPLVEFLAERILQRLPRCVEGDDLKSAGVFGLMGAIDGFDMSRGIKFETYCSVRVRGAILDELRARDWVPRVVRSRAQKRDQAQRALTAEHGRPAMLHEVAARLGWTEREVEESMKEEGRAAVLSLGGGEDASERTGGSRLDSIEDPRPGGDPLKEVQRRDVADMVWRSLSTKERRVIVLYYYEQITMREIGEVLGLSESRVCQIHSRVLKRLRDRMLPMREVLLSR
jgi:RNA polymerase sigma factor for flagellar operon FliA